MTARCSTWFLVLSMSARAIAASLSGIAGPRRGAGERVRRDGAAVDRDEQLGRGAEEPVDGEPVARPERRLQAVHHAVAVERPARRHGDLAGDHRLDEPAVAHGPAGRLDGVEVDRRRRDLVDLVRVGRWQRWRRRRRASRRRRRSLRSEIGSPAPAVERLGDDDPGDHDLAGLARFERNPAEADRATTGRRRVEAGLVDVVDRRRAAPEHRRTAPAARPRVRRSRPRRGRTGTRRRGRCR